MALDLRLTQWEQSVDEVLGTGTFEPLMFQGAAPILALTPQRFKIVSQTGRAVGWRARYVPPAALYPNSLVEPPRVSTRRISILEWETTWSYVMAVDASTTVDVETACKYPASPTLVDIT